MSARYLLNFHLEQRVRIISIDAIAHVMQICIAGNDSPDNLFVTYEISWFANGSRQTTWCHAFEIEDASDDHKRVGIGFSNKHMLGAEGER